VRRLSPLHPNVERDTPISTTSGYNEYVSEEDVAVVRRSLEEFIAGDPDSGWSLWSEDAIGIPPKDWPEGGQLRGRDTISAQFEGWNAVFGPEWTRSMTIEQLDDLGEGRILAALGFATTGVESGVPIDQQLAAIYTVEEGEIVAAEFFMSWDEARERAG
jgi:ketosteroid isomerase-like protein